MAESLGIKNFKNPITLKEFISTYNTSKYSGEKFLINELDLCLSDIGIIGYTNTDSEEVEKSEQGEEYKRRILEDDMWKSLCVIKHLKESK